MGTDEEQGQQRSGRHSDDQLNRVSDCHVELAGLIRKRYGTYTKRPVKAWMNLSKDRIRSPSEYQMANVLFGLQPGNGFSVYEN
jgi:hypothetical protein